MTPAHDRLRRLAEFPGYAVDENGAVWSLESNWRGYGARKLNTTLNSSGYPSVRMETPEGRRIRRPVHSLVAAAFLPPPTDGQQLRHLDGNKDNNAPTNLAWGTAAENSADRDRHGTTARGVRNGSSVLTDDDVRRIRLLANNGATTRDLVSMFGVSQVTIDNIKSRRRWAHLGPPLSCRCEFGFAHDCPHHGTDTNHDR